MKKFSSKFIASSVLAVLVASAMAVSAAAVGADYRDDPSGRPVYTPPATGSVTGDTSGSTDKTDDKTDESTGANVIGPEAVKNAIATSAVIDVVVIDGKAIVQEAAMGEIAKGDKPVTFKVANDASQWDYYVTIHPEDISKAKDFNLAMDVRVVSQGPLGKGLTITPVEQGDFGLRLFVTVESGAFTGINLDNAKCFYVSDDAKVTIQGEITVNIDASVTTPAISHASAYVITDVDLIALAESLDIDLGDDDDDDDDVIIGDDDDVIIGDDDDDTAGKDDTVVVNPGSAEGTDANPVTGTTLALGSLAVFAAAAVATSKKRK